MQYKTVTEALRGFFRKALNKLPNERRAVAEYYIPKWPTMSESQRQERALEIDRQRELKQKIKINKIERIGTPPPGSAADDDYAWAFAEFASKTENAAPPSPAPAAPPGVPAQNNSTKPPRRDSITTVIELAQSNCRDPKDTAEVWARMAVFAQAEQEPFLASTEDGLKYHSHGKDKYFTRDALHKRLHRELRVTPAKSR